LSTPFQNRVVGTVIVAAVAIIFLPDLLDGNKKKHNAEFENIPTPPSIELNTQQKVFPGDKLQSIQPEVIEVVELEQDNVLELADDENVESASTTLSTDTIKVNTLKKVDDLSNNGAKNTKPINKPKVVTSLPEKINAKESWVIQLGSFRHKKNVLELVDKLKQHGYTTYTRPIKTKNGTLTKVFVGPNINKASLQNKIKPLKELTHVEGKVTRYYPTK